MSWQDRLREAAYTSPSGVRIPFMFEDVERAATARGTMFEFPGVKGGYGQRTGEGPRRFPLRVFFSGSDCDLQSDAFFDLLLEDGVGKLEHPRYGTHDVVTLGDITQRDDLKTAANQSVVEVTLWRTTGAVYPAVGLDLPSTLNLALLNFNSISGAQFGRVMNLRSALARARAATSTLNMVATVRSQLRRIATTTRASMTSFTAATGAITGAMDLLIGQPLQLASLLLDLVQAPARALERIKDRLEAYRGLAQSLIARFSALGGTTGGAVESDAIAALNDFNEADLLVCGCVAASALACLETEFSTKGEALESAEELLSQLEVAVAWRDSRGAEFGQVDTGESYQALQELVALTAGYLVQVSFTLLPERRVVLDRARSVIDLCAELYGEVDGKLDYLIATNNLSGDEILELPTGGTVVYYV